LGNTFEFEWEQIQYTTNCSYENIPKGKVELNGKKIIVCDFENKSINNMELGNSTITDETNLSGRKSNKIEPNYGQSAQISMPIDSLFQNKDTVLCRVSCWVFSKNKTKGELKLKIENSANNGEQNLSISDLFGNNFPSNDWNYIFIEKQLIRSQLQGGNLQFFITNFDNKDPIFADDFQISISY
jgi:hypothetical protein